MEEFPKLRVALVVAIRIFTTSFAVIFCAKSKAPSRKKTAANCSSLHNNITLFLPLFLLHYQLKIASHRSVFALILIMI